MDDRALERNLQTIGKACFARYFEHFADGRLSRVEVARLILERESYRASATGSRVSAARRIINAKRDADALKNVASSEKVDDIARDKARALLTSGFLASIKRPV